MAMDPISVLFVGGHDRREFAETRHVLASAARLVEAPDPLAAGKLLADQQLVPSLIVIATAWPGEFSQASIDRLRQLAPLAPVVTLLGAWCEGETRSGHPCPGATRLYWHEGRSRSARELARMAAGRASTWTLPATATEEERLLAAAEVPLPRGQGLVAVYARHADMAGWLSAACRAGGYSTVRLGGTCWPQVEGVTAGIFDATDLGPDEAAALERMVHALGRTPVVAILGFPRVEHRDRALACGATAVLSKPLLLEDLLSLLPCAATTRN